MRAPRLADIAKQVGVSEATVSRVLNDKPGVSAETREAVLTAVDLLGYDRPAKLRKRSAGLVGLITPELTNPVFPAFAQVIETLLSRHGYTPVLCTQTPGGIHEDDYVQMLLERGVSGIVYVSGQHADTWSDPSRYVEVRDAGVPIVCINGYMEGVDAPFISADEVGAVGMAVDHLVDLGHERIGLAVGHRRYQPVQRKITGFRQAMADRLGVVDVSDLVVETWFSVEGGVAAAATLVDRGCTAVLCASDIMAIGAMRGVQELGLTVPDDVSVVGYDDSPLMAFTDPPLTTIRQAVSEMAAAAVDALLADIGGVPLPRAEYVFRTELVVRGSTGPVSVRTGSARCMG